MYALSKLSSSILHPRRTSALLFFYKWLSDFGLINYWRIVFFWFKCYSIVICLFFIVLLRFLLLLLSWIISLINILRTKIFFFLLSSSRSLLHIACFEKDKEIICIVLNNIYTTCVLDLHFIFHHQQSKMALFSVFFLNTTSSLVSCHLISAKQQYS